MRKWIKCVVLGVVIGVIWGLLGILLKGNPFIPETSFVYTIVGLPYNTAFFIVKALIFPNSYHENIFASLTGVILLIPVGSLFGVFFSIIIYSLLGRKRE